MAEKKFYVSHDKTGTSYHGSNVTVKTVYRPASSDKFRHYHRSSTSSSRYRAHRQKALEEAFGVKPVYNGHYRADPQEIRNYWKNRLTSTVPFVFKFIFGALFFYTLIYLLIDSNAYETVNVSWFLSVLQNAPHIDTSWFAERIAEPNSSFWQLLGTNLFNAFRPVFLILHGIAQTVDFIFYFLGILFRFGVTGG